MTQANDYRAAGLETFARMMGETGAAGLERSATSGAYLSATAALALDFAFGAIWSRPGLEMKQRSLVVLAILVATRDHAELRNHIRIGVRNGLSNGEIEEALIQCIPYLGFPAVASAMGPVIETLREIGRDPAVATPAERGQL